MGCRRSLILVLVIGFVIAVVLCFAFYFEDDYTRKLELIFDENDTVLLGDVFSFQFDRAYIIDDCYLSGEGFSKANNLNISIEQVESGVSENIGRIVFVDNHGDYIYEYRYKKNEVNISWESITIFPDSVIERTLNQGEYEYHVIGGGLRELG